MTIKDVRETNIVLLVELEQGDAFMFRGSLHLHLGLDGGGDVLAADLCKNRLTTIEESMSVEPVNATVEIHSMQGDQES